MEGVTARVRKVMKAVFGSVPADDAATFAYKDHPRWDSLGHIQLVLALEKEFGVKFSSEDVVSARDLGKIVEILRRAGRT